MSKKLWKAIDAHVDGIIARNPKAVAELESFVEALMRKPESARAERRKALERMKRKSMRLYGNPKFANHLACCNTCCANARWTEGFTKAERVFYSSKIEG